MLVYFSRLLYILGFLVDFYYRIYTSVMRNNFSGVYFFLKKDKCHFNYPTLYLFIVTFCLCWFFSLFFAAFHKMPQKLLCKQVTSRQPIKNSSNSV